VLLYYWIRWRGLRGRQRVSGDNWIGEYGAGGEIFHGHHSVHVSLLSLCAYSYSSRHQVPTRMVFLNKLDRPGASLHSSFRAILSHKLHPKPMLLTLPIASFATARYDTGEPGIEGILDLVNWEVWKWSNGGISRIQLPKSAKELLDDTSVFPASHPLKEHLLEARSSLVDNLSLLSPSLFSDFDALPPSPSPYLSLPSSSIMSSLRELTLRKEILPVLSGSALKHVGTELLMNYIGELLASPVDIVAPDAKDVTSPGEVQMLAWKVGWDKRKGWMTFVRIYQGGAGCASCSNVRF
jgi:elongation factor G